MDGSSPLADRRNALIARQASMIDAAIQAVETRQAWSPFKDSPSTKIHGHDKPVAGKAAFEAHLNRPFDLDQPGVIGHAGEEISPYTQQSLGITYPVSDPQA